jgi:hypothetical protein
MQADFYDHFLYVSLNLVALAQGPMQFLPADAPSPGVLPQGGPGASCACGVCAVCAMLDASRWAPCRVLCCVCCVRCDWCLKAGSLPRVLCGVCCTAWSPQFSSGVLPCRTGGCVFQPIVTPYRSTQQNGCSHTFKSTPQHCQLQRTQVLALAQAIHLQQDHKTDTGASTATGHTPAARLLWCNMLQHGQTKLGPAENKAYLQLRSMEKQAYFHEEGASLILGAPSNFHRAPLTRVRVAARSALGLGSVAALVPVVVLTACSVPHLCCNAGTSPHRDGWDQLPFKDE